MRRYKFTITCLVLLAIVLVLSGYGSIRQQRGFAPSDPLKLRADSATFTSFSTGPYTRGEPLVHYQHFSGNGWLFEYKHSERLNDIQFPMPATDLTVNHVVTLELSYFPIGVVLLILAMIQPLVRSLRIGGQLRRTRRRHCGVCGYDLRSSSDRCPECGTPVTQEYLLY